MKRPNCDAEDAMEQAGDTIQLYFSRAVRIIDDKFGCGYSSKNPILVAELVKAQANDFENCSKVDYMYEIADAIAKIHVVEENDIRSFVKNLPHKDYRNLEKG